MLSMQLPQGIQQFNLCSRQALPTPMYQWNPKELSYPDYNFDYSPQFQGNLFYEQQKRIKFLEDELKRHKSQIEDLSTKLVVFEQEKAKEAKKKVQSRYWTPEEHERFLEALDKFGSKDVKAISNYVGTRSATQVRTHAQKYFLRLEREKHQGGDGKKSSEDYETPESSEGRTPKTKKKRVHSEMKGDKRRTADHSSSKDSSDSSEESNASDPGAKNEDTESKPFHSAPQKQRASFDESPSLLRHFVEKERSGDKEPPAVIEVDAPDCGDEKRIKLATSNSYSVPYSFLPHQGTFGMNPPVGFNASIFGGLPRAIQLPDGLGLSTALPNPMNQFRPDGGLNMQGHDSLSNYMASIIGNNGGHLVDEQHSNQNASQQQFIELSSVFHSVYP